MDRNYIQNVVKKYKNGNFFEYLGQEIRRIPSIANKHTASKVARLEKVAIKMVLKMLDRFSKQDEGSDELLCFGYHVLAKKIQLVIIGNIKGGLGNQMFQYAYAKALQQKGFKVSIDISKFKTYKLHGGYHLDKFKIDLNNSSIKREI